MGRLAFVVLVLAGCRPVSIVAQPNVPTLAGAEASRCRSSAGHDQPLVTEWPAAEKANLETQVRQGGVVVSFTGCTMTVLTGCRAREPYYWMRTTPSSDWLEIKSEDDLYAKLPLGAASLQGELKGSGSLTMQTTITGQYRLSVAPGTMPAIEGDCRGATHVVSGISIGAYQLDAGGTTRGNITATAAVIGSTGATSTASKSIIRRSGEPTACASSTDQAPDASCSSPIQMFLTSVRAPGPAQPATFATGRPMPMPGAPLEVQLVSADAETTWDVIVDGRKACTTPCTQHLEPSRTLLLREQSGLLSRTSRVTVGNLHNWTAVGGVQVKAQPTSTWNLAGLTRMAGIFYAVAGAGFGIACFASDDDTLRDGMCTMAGLSGAMGVGLFALGTWVMSSPGKADAAPLSRGY